MRQFLKITSLALLTIGFLAACGKKGSNGSAATTGLTANCTNCSGITATRITTAQIIDSKVRGQVELHGDQYEVQRAYQEAMVMRGDARYTFNYYRGAVIMAGTLNFMAPVNAGQCVIPAGTYAIRTVLVGSKMSPSLEFQVQEIILDGPRDFRIQVGTSWFFPADGEISLTLYPKSCPYY